MGIYNDESPNNPLVSLRKEITRTLKEIKEAQKTGNTKKVQELTKELEALRKEPLPGDNGL